MNDSTQKSHYDQIYPDSESEYGMPDRKIISDTLQKRIISKKILSVGCGSGNDIWYLADDNFVTGLDYSIGGLSVGKKHNIHGVISDLNFSPLLPFEDDSFDIVICKDILEHILDPLFVLQEARRIVKSDGYIVISVPNHFHLPSRIRILLGKGLMWKSVGSDHGKYYQEWDYMHIRFFTFNGFGKLLKKSKLTPIKWFWDFGNLAHYNNPDMWLEPQQWKRKHSKPLTTRGKLGLNIIQPLWKLFNLLFPKPLRSLIVSKSPNLLCAGFYVWVR